MELTLNESQIRELTVNAILQTIDQKGRDLLVQKAIQHLLAPDKSQFGSGKSPLERHFEYAVEQVCKEVVTKNVQTDLVLQSKLKELMSAAVDKFFNSQQAVVIEKMAEGLRKGLTGDKY